MSIFREVIEQVEAGMRMNCPRIDGKKFIVKSK